MGFVKRLNSKELVGDPCNGAEVYPITATNAVYREGGESLEEILTRLGNSIDSKKVLDVTQDFAHNKIHISYTDGTSSDITYDRLGDFNVSSSTSGGTKTFTISFKKPNNTTVSQTLEVPIVTDQEKQTWNNKSDFTGYTSNNKLSASYISGLASVATSGSYSDLTNPPDLAPFTNISLRNSGPYDPAGNISGNDSYFQFIKIGKVIQLQFHIKYLTDRTIPQYSTIYDTSVYPDTNVPFGSYTGIAVFQISSSVAGSGVSGDIENLIPFKIEKELKNGNDVFSLQIMNSHRMTDVWGSAIYIATNDTPFE